MDRPRFSPGRRRNDVLDRNWPASLEEGPQDQPGKGLLASRPASSLPIKGIRAFNSSAVRITRVAKVGGLLSCM
jgi:hypothetical protein